MNGELDRQIVGQTDRKHEISVAAITGESEASARDVRLTKCHSDHLKVKDKHTQSGAEKQKVESRVSLSNLFQNTFIYSILGRFQTEFKVVTLLCIINIKIGKYLARIKLGYGSKMIG